MKSSLHFCKRAAPAFQGIVSIRQKMAARSAHSHPRRSIQGLNSQKYTAPPPKHRAAPYRRTTPPQAHWDHINRAAVTAHQKMRSSSGPSRGSLTRERSTRNRSYSRPMAAPSRAPCHRAATWAAMS